VVVPAVLLLCTAWCIPHLRVSCADLTNSSIGRTVHNTNNGSSSRNSSSSSTVLLLHLCSSSNMLPQQLPNSNFPCFLFRDGAPHHANKNVVKLADHRTLHRWQEQQLCQCLSTITITATSLKPCSTGARHPMDALRVDLIISKTSAGHR
jgi:hypothetical protein